MSCCHPAHRAVLFAALLSLSTLAAAAGVTVRSLDGVDGGLGDHLVAGKWNVIMVWTTYCGVCRQQYPAISEFHTRHHDSDAVVLGVSLDGRDAVTKVRDYRAQKAHTFPSVLADADEFRHLYERTTGEAFTGTPTYLLFDPSGKLRAYLDGPTTLASLERFIAQ